ncbi:PepSY domain-containing protein [Novosphingobium sp. Chol11]|uniref:PepSY domain-containing protein n=1 Tax=Novosphingobium sp. Chol11 TaxID=1385763 RepID=UPI0025D34254|nr:PepSY domain-containing protein [Novosphingobium sp. Chol11]
MMRQLSRWHVWIGWLVGVPLVLWTASGLFMTSWPIEQVRGEDLRAPPAQLAIAGLIMPHAPPLRALKLTLQTGRAVWIAEAADGRKARYDARSGAALGRPGEAEARAIAGAARIKPPAITAMTAFPASAPPLDLRTARPSWQARFADDVHVYVDGETGEVLALRTPLWRVFDFMWGLHIMDLQGRENTHHPLLIGSAALALLTSLLGLVLLGRPRRKAR